MKLAELFTRTSLEYQIPSVLELIEERTQQKISWFIIDTKKCVYEAGAYSSDLETDANRNISDMIHAFYLDPSINGRVSLNPIFGLRKDHVNEADHSRLLAIHEIAHAIDMLGLIERLGLQINDCDVKNGNEIQKIANKIDEYFGWGNDIFHNQNFGAILSFLIRRRYPNDYALKLNEALSKNFIDDYSNRFVC